MKDEGRRMKRVFFNAVRIFIISITSSFFLHPSSFAASVVASVNGIPITDTDITARATVMNAMGQGATNNRRLALTELVNDMVKTSYASELQMKPADKDVVTELGNLEKRMGHEPGYFKGTLGASAGAAALNAMRAEMSWQMVVGRTIMPETDAAPADIAAETAALERERGLPLEMTIIRLVGIPQDTAKQLPRVSSCDAAESAARDMGGEPVKFTALQYELSTDARAQIAGLKNFQWSPWRDYEVLLICGRKKTSEYAELDKIIEQNAKYKKAMAAGDQLLKRLKRKAMIIIQDDRYKIDL
ncbi:MAG: hypothetical protein LBR41_03065 [Rickettsiales bacterium]|nr:hypothetical protein [Rickettsiales bacterium]